MERRVRGDFPGLQGHEGDQRCIRPKSRERNRSNIWGNVMRSELRALGATGQTAREGSIARAGPTALSTVTNPAIYRTANDMVVTMSFAVHYAN